jgi:hypothetical protein
VGPVRHRRRSRTILFLLNALPRIKRLGTVGPVNV